MKIESLFSVHFLTCFHNYLIKIILPGIPLGVNLKKYLKDRSLLTVFIQAKLHLLLCFLLTLGSHLIVMLQNKNVIIFSELNECI